MTRQTPFTVLQAALRAGVASLLFLLPGLSAIAQQTPDAAQEKPIVRCVLVVPPGEQPWPDAQKRLSLVLKDAQWWYSCQMEAYGYGAKTFALETDEAGQVVVHLAQLEQTPPALPDEVPSGVIQAAEKVLGKPAQRKGTIMVVVYNGYYWTNREAFEVAPKGRGLAGRWAHFSGWHFFSVNPQGWNDFTPVPDLPDENPFFPPLHTQVLKVFKEDGVRTVAERTSSGHNVFFHEMGHAFGLDHPARDAPLVADDVMVPGNNGSWNARGSFVESIRNEWTCLSPSEAALLNKNPLFEVRQVGPPSSGAPRSVGMRGAQNDSVALHREQFAPIEAAGQGFKVQSLAKGELSQSNRNYLWLDVPAELQGFGFTQMAGGVPATLSVHALAAGRIYVATGEKHSPLLTQAGWTMIPTTLSYGPRDLSRVFPVFLYFKESKTDAVTQIPQCAWTGTLVIAPRRN